MENKLNAVVENKSPTRDSRRVDQKGDMSRWDRSKSPGRIQNSGKRYSTAFRCFKCNQEGHMARYCTEDTWMRCFYCKKEGHIIRRCFAKSKTEANAKQVKD